MQDDSTELEKNEIETIKPVKHSSKFFIFAQRLTYIVILLFCFIFFPAFFIFNSLDIFFKSNIENLKQQKLIEMSQKLEYLDKYSNNKKYLHFLLLKISQFAQISNKPTEYLETNIKNLKKEYPNKFKFVVWDEKGLVIDKLTDKSGYRYILKTLYESLKEVTETIKIDPNYKLTDLETLKKNTNILRTFLGRIFIAENLKFPLNNGKNSGPFITEMGHGLTSVWFSINKKISFLCFISDDILDKYTGLEKIVKKLNNDSELYYGFSIIPKFNTSVTDFPEQYQDVLNIALAIFENAGDSIFENEKAIIKMSMPQPEIRTFCYLPKTDDIWNIDYKRNFWFYSLTSIILMIYCLLGFWFLYKKHFFSIRWKLTTLFLLANLAPILVLGFIAREYLQNKKISLKNEIVSDLEKTLREYDAHFITLIDNYSNRLNKIVSKESERIGNSLLKKEDIVLFENLYKEFNCSDFYLIASSSGFISIKRDKSKTYHRADFIENICKSVLAYSNKDFEDTKKNDVLANIYNPSSSEFIRLYFKNLQKVNELSIGDISWIYYSYILGDSQNFNNNYLLMLQWDKELFKKNFLEESFYNYFKPYKNRLFYIKTNTANFSTGSKELEPIVNSIIEKNSGMTEKISGYTTINNKKYIYISLNGSSLTDCKLFAFYPEEYINKEINLVIVQIVIGAFVSLLLTLIIGHILSLQFLKPIHDLGDAALAIGERNFAHRVPIADKDEFGHLNQVFNRVIEGLGDFDVARTIQESLFPGNNFDVGNFKIFGRSVVMTTLGGDYYDCFKINDEYQGIIIGDVAGHGIPAGLMMAMAKSAVLTSSEELKLDPAAFTTRIHKIFHAIKNERLKRMMTFQYFVLRVNDGHFVYTNAGHCFPVIVDSINKTAQYIEYIATPLGIGNKCRCKNQEIDLKEGQSLVLYTDGIVEAYSAEGEQYGYNRFQDCLPKYYDPNPEIFYYNLYNKVYKVWSPKPDDDLTLIIINRQ